MTTRIVVYTSMMAVPKVFHKTLFGLTLRRGGYMLLAAQVLLGWRIKHPVVVCYGNGWPIGWMLLDPIDKSKLNMYVSRAHRGKGIARRMAVALKKKYPKMRLGVYPQPGTAAVLKGLAKPRAKY